MTRKFTKAERESPEYRLARILERSILQAYIEHNTHHEDLRWKTALMDFTILLKIAKKLLPLLAAQESEECLKLPSDSKPKSRKPRGQSRSADSSTSPILKLPARCKDLPGQRLFPQVEEILTSDPGTSDS